MKMRNKKTGEIRIADAREDGIYLWDELTQNWWKYGLSLLASGWEYYVEQKEPLIKDEKARAIFKMWADNFKNAMIDGTFTFYVDREYHSFMVNLKPTGESHFEDVAEIDLNFDCDGLEDGKSYTLAELCGDEEE